MKADKTGSGGHLGSLHVMDLYEGPLKGSYLLYYNTSLVTCEGLA